MIKNGPEVIKKHSGSTQLSMKFKMLIKLHIKISRNSAFSGLDKTAMLFFVLINAEMRNNYSHFSIYEQETFMPSYVEHKISFITSGPGFAYVYVKLYPLLGWGPKHRNRGNMRD